MPSDPGGVGAKINVGQKSKYWSTIEFIGKKKEISVKNRNFRQKSPKIVLKNSMKFSRNWSKN